MSDDTSQTQHTNPFAKAAAEQTARTAAAFEAYAELEAQMWDHWRTAIDESARLSKEAVAYAQSTAAQLRKLSMEATKRATESVLP